MRYMKYLLTVFIAFLVCAFFVGVAYIKGDSIHHISLAASFIFGIAFVPLVTIRLPIFKDYYLKDLKRFNVRYDDMANRKAAPVMCSLVTAFVLALLLYLLGQKDFWLSCFCGALASGIVSFYYEP